MTCKDCIYFNRCVVLGVELDIKHNKEADKNCRHFKNKADFVEVVRCKDCKYWETKMDGFCRASYGLCEINNENQDFCSYGERKFETDTNVGGK